MIWEVDAVAEEIKELLRSYKLIFPAAEVQRKVKEFICRSLGAIYKVNWQSPRSLYGEFLKMRQSMAEDILAVISQSQFVDTMFREAMEEQSLEIQDALWPGYYFSVPDGVDTLRTFQFDATVKFGLRTGATVEKHRLDLTLKKFEMAIPDPESSSGQPPMSDSVWEETCRGATLE
jgi:hypothetical protein